MDDAARARVRAGLHGWFRRPPRRHGEAIYTRHVSFLELFYDLVYVVVIGRAAHHLAAHLDWSGVRDFVVVFGLIWLAWFNGTFWHELHAREDGRSRLYIFGQMTLLALLAVFAGEATGDDGRAFAVTYAVLFALFTWQWYLVQRIDDPRYRPTTTRYLAGMVATVVAVAATAVADDRVRLAVWAAVVLGWAVGGILLTAADRTAGFGEGVTASLVERVGLFTIVVLGEVVVGVVVGISDADDRSAGTIATGMIGLTIGMGLWWNYFDLLGRRVPGRQGVRLALWLYVHLPLTMAIAAGGAAMVSLVEHAGDARVPAPTAWLLSCSVGVVLAAITIASQALPADALRVELLKQVAPTFGVAAVAVTALAVARPAPMAYVIALSIVLAAAWLRLFVVHLAAGGDLDAFQGGHSAPLE
jgi:low temperature requirement protein LtrA